MKFPRAAIIGGASESVVSKLADGRAGVEEVHCLDHSPVMLDRIQRLHKVRRYEPPPMPPSVCSTGLDLG